MTYDRDLTLVCTTLASYPAPLTLIAWEEKKGLEPNVFLTSHFSMILCKMSLRLCTSCVCSWEAVPKHSTALFSPVELKKDLPGCLSWFLLVPFAKGNESRIHKNSKLHKFRLSYVEREYDMPWLILSTVAIFHCFMDSIRVYQIPFQNFWGNV